MKRMESIEITFENLDWIMIPSGYFAFQRMAEREDKTFRYYRIVFAENVNNLGSDIIGDIYSIMHGGETLFERISRKDITQIKLTYSDRSEEQFDILWKETEDNEYVNQLQRVYTDSEGRLICELPV